MTDVLNITFLSTSMGLGGADRLVFLLARELKRRNHAVKIISIVPTGRMAEDARGYEIPVSTLGIESNLGGALSVPSLRRQVGETDVVHSHMFHANLLARVSRPLLRTRAVVSTIHNVYESAEAYHQPQRKTIRNRLYDLTDGLADCTTFVCQAASDRYLGLGVVGSDTEVVYNGIDSEESRPDLAPLNSLRDQDGAADTFVWLTVGRFFQMKDYPNLLRAFARTASENAELWIVGHGEREGAIKRLASDLNIDAQVRFLGVVEDVTRLMKAADGFVLGSRWEGFPMVLLEAQVSALPVVSTRVGGIPELVDDGQTGLLAPPEDYTALARAMDEITKMDSAERLAMGQTGRERVVERFSIGRIADQWIDLYRRLLDS